MHKTLKNIQCDEFHADISIFDLTDSQKDVIVKAATRPFSIIQGPPGTGKTHVISALTYALLQQYPNDRIILCGTSNQSVENIVSATAHRVKKLKKKFVWLATQSRDFKIDDDITYEQEFLMFNQMLQRKTKEGRLFADLQWRAEREQLVFEELSCLDSIRSKLEENIASKCSVLCCTLETAGKKCLDKLRFATVIIDEATQAVEPATLVPLIHHAKRLILVGDQMQLGPIVPRDDRFYNSKYNVSLFERCINNGIEPLFLDAQFRMHPDISGFSNKFFYQNKITDMVKPEDRKIKTKFIKDHVMFIDIDGIEEEESKSFFNQKEIDATLSIIDSLFSTSIDVEKFGVISPYAAQVKKLRIRFKEQYNDPEKAPKVKFGSVDSFQGSQRDYIIITTVRSGIDVGFLKDERRLNVAVTRARICLIVIGNSKCLRNDRYWNGFIEYCKEKNAVYKDVPKDNSARSDAAKKALFALSNKVK